MNGSGEKEGVERFSKRPDLLSERWNVTYSIPDGLLQELPDLEGGERGYILGATETEGRRVRLSIQVCGKGLPQPTEDDPDLAGAKAALSPLVLMRDRLQAAAEDRPEFSGLIFLGELRSTSINEIDLLELKDAYESSDFRPHEPCIIGVIKKNDKGEHAVEFSRIVRRQGTNFYDWQPVGRAERPTG